MYQSWCGGGGETNGAGSILLLGGGGETHGFSSVREHMHFVFILDKILLAGGCPYPDYWGAVAPCSPLPAPMGGQGARLGAALPLPCTYSTFRGGATPCPLSGAEHIPRKGLHGACCFVRNFHM